MKTYTLKKEFTFDAAHKLQDTDELTTKKCCDFHGHMWRVIIKIVVNEIKGDMIIDFGSLKQIVNQFDHQNLNEKVDFNPTAENLSKFFINEIKKILPEFKKLAVTIEESPEAQITAKEKR